MAWRITHSVTKGEIDNSERGIVRGRIWLAGVAEPIVLQLKGNASPDLAGCVLRFRNPTDPIPLRPETKLQMLHKGPAGDLTASRKVRVPGPFPDAESFEQEDIFPPDQFANALYLEWYTSGHGRVVIESTSFELQVSPPAWRLSRQEELQRQADSAQAFATFLAEIDKAVDAATYNPPDDRPWNEFDYEKFLRESDARTDKYGELLDKYGHSPESEEIIAREMGWSGMETSPEEVIAESDDEAAEPSAEDDDDDAGWEYDPEAVLEPDPHTEGIDWVRDETGDVCHPLYLRVRRSSTQLWRDYEELGYSDLKHPDLEDLLTSWQILAAKLAGALNSLAYGAHEGAFVVACLKRSLPHLQNTQRALEKVAPQKLLPPEKVREIRSDLFSTREEILRLMGEFRGKSSEQ